MKILVINSGSSSIKFKLFEMDTREVVCKGFIEQIGFGKSYASVTNNLTGKTFEMKGSIPNHGFGIDVMNRMLEDALGGGAKVDAVGHRVVQGADLFSESVLIDYDVMEKIRELIPLAPLHNPAHLAGMRETMRVSPNTPNVAVFDTVFHQTMPKSAYMYPLPLEFYERFKVRRYGAHGTSHGFVSREAAKLAGTSYDKFSCITLHLGSGSSVAAIKNGRCVDTSMGLTPLEGLMMGTRCGDIDPAIVPFLMKNAGLNYEEIDEIMNKQSGLLAICGTNDMREIEERTNSGDEAAKLAFDMFVRRVKKYIGAYIAILGRIDALVFTAGIGENDPKIRAAICEGLDVFGISLDTHKNTFPSREARLVEQDGAKIKIAVIPTDEELAIALETERVVKASRK